MCSQLRLDIQFCLEKASAVKRQILSLKSSDYPYHDSKEALDLLEAIFDSDIQSLNRLQQSSTDDIIKEVCRHANHNIVKFEPVLGFVLRSSNVRNSFEIYDPLLRLARSLLDDNAKLVLSSEWDFSPYTYPAAFSELPLFVFIGLPATESGNPLILPLAGHELGHSIWRLNSIGMEYSSKVENSIIEVYRKNWSEVEKFSYVDDDFEISRDIAKLKEDLFLRDIWFSSYQFAKAQCEETFCDLMGLRIFGESFLYSFLYLLAPGLGYIRSNDYPAIRTRAKNIVKAAEFFDIEKPDDFEEFFDLPEKYDDSYEGFSLQMADEAVVSLIDDLLKSVKKVCDNKGLNLPSREERNKISKQFQMVTPASNSSSLADVINAGWLIKLNKDLQQRLGSSGDGLIVLNDLILKTLEVQEFEKKMSATGCC